MYIKVTYYPPRKVLYNMHGALVTEGNHAGHHHRNITSEEAQDLYTKYYQLVCSASIVILMQLGFTFLEVGRGRLSRYLL